MQNWNQWQLSSGTVTTSVPQPPVGYAAAAGADPTTLMQSYMQYYNQPAPSGYTPEQWATVQQQGWTQWQQWQQQYQQWQAQYGDKYQETMKQLSAQNINLAVNQAQLPPLSQLPPPLPKEDAAPPPLPPTTANTYHQFVNLPPPNQNNLPLFPAKESATKTTMSQVNVTNYPPPNHQLPPLPGTSQQQLPPLPPETESRQEGIAQIQKRNSNVPLGDESAKKPKLDEGDDELTEAEKTFDTQFKQWEEQFNKWKQQNANHPDKTQYKQYEAKWTSWREKLLERREQMRKKREQQKQAATAKVMTEADKSGKNNISSDDKILNILSNTENQRLINNLLGIGKTLGLTGKQQNVITAAPLPPPPPPPPPPPETTNSSNQSVAPPGTQQTSAQQNIICPNIAPSSWSNQQQWGNNQQYNPQMEASSYGPSMMVPFGHQIMPLDFAQPPPNMPPNNSSVPPNFSQPPPNFPISNNNNGNEERSIPLQNVRGPMNVQDRSSNMDTRFAHHSNDRGNFDNGQQSNFLRRGGSDYQDSRFAKRGDGISNPSGNEQDQFMRQDPVFGKRNDFFNSKMDSQQQRFRRVDRNYNGDFGNNPLNMPNSFTTGNDGRFGSANERFGPPINERFGGGNNRFGPIGNDRFASQSDRFAPNDRLGSDRFGAGERFEGPETDRFRRSGPIDRFGPGNEHRFNRPDNDRLGSIDHFERFPSFADRPGLTDDRFDLKDRGFAPGDRFGPNTNEQFGANDRFGRSNAADCFDPSKDANDHRRDLFSSNLRGFNRNPSFNPLNELSPELRKLMEKRKAASDVFRPSFLSDSERISNVGSLSESFKKIAGDSPFRSSFDFPKNRVGSTLTNASGGIPPPNFQTHPAHDLASSSYNQHPRGSGHSFNNACDNEPPAFPGCRQQGPLESSAKHNDTTDYNERMAKDTEIRLQNSDQQISPINIQSQSPVKHPGDIDPPNPLNLQTDNIEDTKNAEAIKCTDEVDNTTIEQKDDPIITSEDGKDDNREKSEILADNIGDPSLLQQQTGDDKNNNIEKKEEDNSDNNGDDVIKKSESLPFMGENDPRPEDLNIEPPPELPNLGLIPPNMEIGSQNITETFSEAFDSKGTTGSQFNVQPGNVFSGLRMEFKMSAPFEPRGPPPMLGPRAPQILPVDSGLFQSSQRHINNTQVGPPQGPSNAEQFGPNTSPNDDRQFNFRRPNDDQYNDGKDRNDESVAVGGDFRGSNNNQFRPMDVQISQFGGPRAPKSGKFGTQFGPRDSPFFPRTPGLLGPKGNDIQFGRHSNDHLNSGAFGPRGPSDMSRGFNDMSLGSRRPGDSAQFGSELNNNNRFGRTNETIFDKRSFDSGESPFGFSNESRRFFEGPSSTGPQGINDTPSGGPRPPLNDTFSQRSRSPNVFDEKRFDSRDPNDFKDRPFAATRDYMHRSGTYTRRGQHEDNTRQSENPTIGPEDPFSNNCLDRNIDVEMRKDNAKEYFRYTSTDASYRKELDENLPLPSSSYGSTNVSDERPKLSCESFPCPSYGEAKPDSDRQSKFHGLNLFVKRSQSTRSPGGEFRATRQFNYNHGEVGAGDKKQLAIEFTPTKIIDYGHISRPAVIDHHLSPIQCFDYAHGDLKPVVPIEYQDQQHQSRGDFRDWVESEQTVKEYEEKMRSHENPKECLDKKRSDYDNYEKSGYDARKLSSDYGKQRIKEHMDWQQQANDKRSSSERERRENEDRKEKSSLYDPLEEQRFFEHDDASDHQNSDHCYQSDRSVHRERAQETYENSRREMSKDNDKDENRSKGSVNWQENPNKNAVDTKVQDISSDTSKNVESTTPKTLELAKMPNYTMVDDLLCPPGRQNRPPKIAIILRGPPGSGKSFVAKLIKDKEVEQGGSAPRILSLDDYFLVEKEIEIKDDNGKKVTVKEMVYEYEEAMEQSYVTSLVKAFKKNITDGFFNFIILDCINEKISDYEEMWSFAKTKGFKVYVCEMEMDLQICLKRNIHNRTEDEINRIIDYFEPTPSYHQKLDVNSMLQEQAIEEVDMEDSQEIQEKCVTQNDDSQDSHEDIQDAIGVSKWEKMEAEDKLDRLDGLAKKKSEMKPQTMEDFLQVPDYYNMEDTSGKKRVRWADLEERKEQEKMRAVGFVVGHTNWDRMMDPTKGGSALTRTKYI